LKGIELKNQSWERVIDDCDRDGAFFYIDPPYVMAARSGKRADYKHEFGDGDHALLLE